MDMSQVECDVERIELAMERIKAANEKLKTAGAARPDGFVESPSSSTQSKPSGLLEFRTKESDDRRKS